MQRSGKTFLATLLSTEYKKNIIYPYILIWIYQNLIISALSEMPINKEPKILLLDELHFYLNSRNFKSQADFIYFLKYNL